MNSGYDPFWGADPEHMQSSGDPYPSHAWIILYYMIYMPVSRWLLWLDLWRNPVLLAMQEAKEGDTHAKVFKACGELKANMGKSVRPYLKI